MKETAVLNVSKQTVYTRTEQVNLSACPERPCRSAYYIFCFEHYELLAPSLPQHVSVTKREVDAECRVFQGKWSLSHLFAEVNGKPVFLFLHAEK